MGRKPPEPFRVIKEKKRLVLSKLDESIWGFNSKLYEGYSLQEWIDHFEKDKDYTWSIEYVTTDFIIMTRTKYRKQTMEETKKELIGES